MTNEQLAPFREELASVPKFQWIKTEKAGKITYFKDVVYHNNMILVEFTDGTRVNYDMLGSAVMKIQSDDMLLDVGTTQESISMGISMGTSPEGGAGSNVTQVNIGKTPKNANPIHALLNKQKANPVPVEISIELNLPPLSLYKVLSQSFDNANEEIVEFIVADLDVPQIRAAVREAITKFYSEDNE